MSVTVPTPAAERAAVDELEAELHGHGLEGTKGSQGITRPGVGVPRPDLDRSRPVHLHSHHRLDRAGLLPLGHHHGSSIRRCRQLRRDRCESHDPGVVPEHHRIRHHGRDRAACGRLGPGAACAVQDAQLAADVLPLVTVLPAHPVRGIRLAGDVVPVQPGVRPRQPIPELVRNSGRRLADDGLRGEGRRAAGLRLAELRLHLPAFHRRCRRHPEGGVRGVGARRRDRAGRSSGRSPCR